MNKHTNESPPIVAVVEDNPVHSRLIGRLLLSYNYEYFNVLEAQNGVDGFDIIVERLPDLILLDLLMPVMDGFDLLRKLKKDRRTKRIPVVVISAKSLTGAEYKFLRANTDSIWEKGNFDPSELVKHIVEEVGADINQSPRLAADN